VLPVIQALNPIARHQARMGIGRVTPEILSRHDRNFLDELVAVAICVGEITMNQTRKRFIGKANDVNTKAGHTGDSMPALAKNRHSAD
jgi:hypothetical protein